MGYYSLRPVQEQTYSRFQKPGDFAVQATTGSGKTLAFLLPALESIEEENPSTQIVIISPTRELALQTGEKARQLATYTTIHTATCIGGIPLEKQINALRHKPQVLIGTPGRLVDLLESGHLHLENCRHVILDEADQILSTGQQEETHTLLRQMHCPVALFSATITNKVKQFLSDQADILYLDETGINEAITAFYCETEDKLQTLFSFFKTTEITSCIVFVSHRTMAAMLAKEFQKRHILAAPFSAAYNERKRLAVLRQFREGELRILVATDAMARGMDIQDVSHIVHYELPEDTETLIHRSGRTAHNTSTGTVLVLLNARDRETEPGKYCLAHFSPYIPAAGKKGTLTRKIEKEKEKKPQAVRLWIRCGRKDKIRPKDLIGALCTIFPFEQIGTLEIQDTYTTVTVFSKTVSLQELSVKGKVRKVEIKKA